MHAEYIEVISGLLRMVVLLVCCGVLGCKGYCLDAPMKLHQKLLDVGYVPSASVHQVPVWHARGLHLMDIAQRGFSFHSAGNKV